MKHIFINDYGIGLGVVSERLLISHRDKPNKEVPLSRVKTITILGEGVSLSSNLLIKCANRGIKVFITDFKNEIISSFANNMWHRVVNVRKSQLASIDTEIGINLAKQLIIGKIKNQKATLLYFSKYHSRQNFLFMNRLDVMKDSFEQATKKIGNVSGDSTKIKNEIMGHEGKVAVLYWDTLKAILPEVFSGRVGRGAEDIINKALNYGYAILNTYVWNCIINAGLEAYAGVLHADRPGKPSLVLDIMEEYRAWVVDRNIIKLRSSLINIEQLTPEIKKRIITEISDTINKSYPYKNRRVTLQSIMQRQVYKLVNAFMENGKYKSYSFKW